MCRSTGGLAWRPRETNRTGSQGFQLVGTRATVEGTRYFLVAWRYVSFTRGDDGMLRDPSASPTLSPPLRSGHLRQGAPRRSLGRCSQRLGTLLPAVGRMERSRFAREEEATMGFAPPLCCGVLRDPPWLAPMVRAPCARGSEGVLPNWLGGPGNRRLRVLHHRSLWPRTLGCARAEGNTPPWPPPCSIGKGIFAVESLVRPATR